MNDKIISDDLRGLWHEAAGISNGAPFCCHPWTAMTLIERLSAAETRVKELDWSFITPDNFPTEDDEVTNGEYLADVADLKRTLRDDWMWDVTHHYTHRRPKHLPKGSL